LEILKKFPEKSIDIVITSPPYWGKREYSNGGIGLEKEPNNFINNLLQVIFEIKRVLKPEGSFWLNIGDTYKNKSLAGIPWRIAIKMIDEQGWILRNEVIWNKVKGGMDNAKDKLGNIHEPLFHFVKSCKYFYDVDAIRSKPQKATIKNGIVISATGVSGIRYKRQIELSTSLTEAEKKNAYYALENILSEVRNGLICDFRMIIRGQQRVTHSNSTNISGRAKEIEGKGYYFLKYHPNGSKPRDVWDIIPEDTQNRKIHFAPFPEDLCKIPILSTCPQNGVVLDPFVGTGTSNAVAYSFGRKSIGIDISEEYIDIANQRFYEPDLFEAVNV
jgi:site-specific DNA-methyltransferase (adenine-specific)